MLNYEKTKYPELYNECTWGKSKDSSIEIIEARNRFAETYQGLMICKSKWLLSLHIGSRLDHLEVYRAKDESRYVLIHNYDEHEFPVKYGFSKYETMYLDNAVTYLQIFKNNYELREFCKMVRKVIKGIK